MTFVIDVHVLVVGEVEQKDSFSLALCRCRNDLPSRSVSERQYALMTYKIPMASLTTKNGSSGQE